MNTVLIRDLDNLDKSKVCILDIREKSDFNKASIKEFEVINIPRRDFENADNLPDKDIYVMGYSGKKGAEIVEALENLGKKAYLVEGGYRSFLSYRLEKIVNNEEEVKARRKEIERSIIKTYRKPIWRAFVKSINNYDMIQDGDRIAVCISGGKDSMLLAKLFQELKKHGKNNFEVEYIVMNPGYNEENWNIIQNNAKLLGIPIKVFNSDIFDVVTETDDNPCYLCARMRRGFLYDRAQELGCNKIALGHHFDDVIETTLMSMLYSGKFETMMPKLYSRNFKNMELIRPMYLVKESAIKNWRDYNELGFIQCACRFTENCADCDGEKLSKRDEMKDLVAHFRKVSSVIDMNIFQSSHNVNLGTVIGYQKDDVKYEFVDYYREKGERLRADSKDECEE